MKEGDDTSKAPVSIAFEFIADNAMPNCHWIQTQTPFQKNAAGKEVLGGFVQVGRDGKQYFIPYGQAVVDSGNPKTPYYDGSGGATLTGDKLIGIMDHPMPAKPSDAFPTHGFHFTTTLVCDGKPLYTFTWDWVKTKDKEGVENLKGAPGTTAELKKDSLFYGFGKIDNGMPDPQSIVLIPNPIPKPNR